MFCHLSVKDSFLLIDDSLIAECFLQESRYSSVFTQICNSQKIINLCILQFCVPNTIFYLLYLSMYIYIYHFIQSVPKYRIQTFRNDRALCNKNILYRIDQARSKYQVINTGYLSCKEDISKLPCQCVGGGGGEGKKKLVLILM